MVKRTFEILFKKWKIFVSLLIIASLIWLLMFDVSKDTIIIMTSFIILTLWLTTIFIMRHELKGEKVSLRDGLYNAMTPFWSSLLILIVLAIECLPICFVIIGYSAAIETNLFADVLALILFILFALAMVALTVYLLSGTLMAMIAVSAPGMYPLTALSLTREVMKGERLKFILRLLVMGLVLVGVWVVVVGIALLLNLWLNNVLIVLYSIYLALCMSVIFAAVYLYLYYRKVLKMEEK